MSDQFKGRNGRAQDNPDKYNTVRDARQCWIGGSKFLRAHQGPGTPHIISTELSSGGSFPFVITTCYRQRRLTYLPA